MDMVAWAVVIAFLLGANLIIFCIDTKVQKRTEELCEIQARKASELYKKTEACAHKAMISAARCEAHEQNMHTMLDEASASGITGESDDMAKMYMEISKGCERSQQEGQWISRECGG